jgi:hypothetical protein
VSSGIFNRADSPPSFRTPKKGLLPRSTGQAARDFDRPQGTGTGGDAGRRRPDGSACRPSGQVRAGSDAAASDIRPGTRLCTLGRPGPRGTGGLAAPHRLTRCCPPRRYGASRPARRIRGRRALAAVPRPEHPLGRPGCNGASFARRRGRYPAGAPLGIGHRGHCAKNVPRPCISCRSVLSCLSWNQQLTCFLKPRMDRLPPFAPLAMIRFPPGRVQADPGSRFSLSPQELADVSS